MKICKGRFTVKHEDILALPILRKNKTTLKKTSYNDAAHCHMTESLLSVVDFDDVKNEYIRIHPCFPIPSSNDALAIIDGKLYFIEFKDGNMQSEIHDVKRKIFESLLIFCDIINDTISFTRQQVNYILVYNKQKSETYIKRLLKRNEVQETPSLDSLMNDLGKLADYNIDYFGLRKQFQNIYLKDVYTYKKEDFNQWLEHKMDSGIKYKP